MKKERVLFLAIILLTSLNISNALGADSGSVSFHSAHAPLYNPPSVNDSDFSCVDHTCDSESSKGIFPREISDKTKFSIGDKLKVFNPTGNICDRVSYSSCWIKEGCCRNCGMRCDGGTLYDYTNNNIKIGFYSSNSASSSNTPIAEYALSSFIGSGIAIPALTNYIYVYYIDTKGVPGTSYYDNNIAYEISFDYTIGTACVPQTCVQLGKQCGIWANTCGTGNVNCGACAQGYSCNSNGQCVSMCSNEQTIMRLSGYENTHGALWDYTNYDYSICYPHFFGADYTGTNYHNCDINNSELVWLSNAINAHASTTQSTSYNTPVCYGDLECRAVANVYNRDANLIADYKFEGNVLDSSMYENHGNIYGPIWTLNGKYGGAFEFDGVDDYIEAPNSISFNNVQTQFTISAWIYRKTDSGKWERIVGRSGPWGFDYWLQITPNDKIGGGFVNDSGKLKGALDANTQGTSIPLNQWVHIAITYNGTTISGYYNGILDKWNLTNNSIRSSARPLYIGRLGSSYNFNGTIDEVKIYNRSLSAGEINNIYQNRDIVPNEGCDINSGEKAILTLDSTTNAHTSNVNYNYPIKICCKHSATTPVGNLFWMDMSGNIISSSNIGDNVYLIHNNTLINYKFNIFEDDLVIDDIIRINHSSVLLGELSRGSWIISNEDFIKGSDDGEETIEDFYFVTNTLISTLLQVANYTNDPPTTKIIIPEKESTFVINKSSGKTKIINFQQQSEDKDDILELTWDFGNSRTQFINCPLNGNCRTTDKYSDCNATSEYNSTGTKMIRLTAKEATRSNSATDLARIYVYKSGLNLFAIIDGPDYSIPVFEPGIYRIDGNNSHVANCSEVYSTCADTATPLGLSCDTITDREDPNLKLYCYLHADSRKLNFTWTIDGIRENNTSPIFQKMFSDARLHTIDLKVRFTY